MLKRIEGRQASVDVAGSQIALRFGDRQTDELLAELTDRLGFGPQGGRRLKILPTGGRFRLLGMQLTASHHLLGRTGQQFFGREILPEVPLTKQPARFVEPAALQGFLSFPQSESPGLKHGDLRTC
jgi:hypothetical protein